MGGRIMIREIYFLFILLALAVCSCRSPKQIKEKTDIAIRKDSNATTNSSLDLQLNIDKTMKQAVDVIIQKVSELNWEYSRTDYSPPDSSGKQHPTHTETGKVNNKTEENSQYDEQVETQYKVVTTYLMNMSQRIESMENRQEHIESEYKEKLTWYQSALIFLGGLFLVYIIVTIYIRLKKP